MKLTGYEARAEIMRIVSEHDVASLSRVPPGSVAVPAVRTWAEKTGLAHRGQRPSHADAETAVLTPEIDAAVTELAGERGKTEPEIRAEILELANGDTDEGSTVAAIGELAALPRGAVVALAMLERTDAGEVTHAEVEKAVQALAKRRGEDYARTFEQVRALTGGERDTRSLRTATLKLAGMRDSETVDLVNHSTESLLEEKETAAQRQRYNRAGLTVSLAQSHVPADTQEPARPDIDAYLEHLMQGPAGRIALGVKLGGPKRLPPHVDVIGSDDYAEHPAHGGNVSTATRAHSGRDHSDKAQPKRGGRKYPGVGEAPAGTGGVDAVMARNPEYFHGDKPYGSVNSYGPRGPYKMPVGGKPQSR